MNNIDILSRFFAAYYHEDYDLESCNIDQIPHSYEENFRGDRELLIHELLRLTKEFPNDEALEIQIKKFGSYYSPARDGISAKEWIHKIIYSLRQKSTI